MTAETTPAIERGAAALDPEAFSPAHEEMARLMGVPESAAGWSRDMARKRARDVLAAALTDDLLARAVFHAIDETRDEGRQASWDGLASSERGYWRGISIDIRTRLLGAES